MLDSTMAFVKTYVLDPYRRVFVTVGKRSKVVEIYISLFLLLKMNIIY